MAAKSTGADMEQNHVTVSLCILQPAVGQWARRRNTVFTTGCVNYRCKKRFLRFFIILVTFNVFFIFQTFLYFFKKRWQSSVRQAY